MTEDLLATHDVSATDASSGAANLYVRFSIALGSAIVIFIAAVVVLQAGAILVGASVSIAATIVAVLIALALLFWQLRDLPLRIGYWAIGAFAAIVAASTAVAAFTTDVGWDSNSYHKVAVGMLAHGWNPLRQSAEAFNHSAANPVQLVSGTAAQTWGLWIDHYPKSSWLFGASMYQISGHIEADKAINLLTIAALFLIGSGFFVALLGTVPGVVLGALLALNPVALDQLFTAYNDGVLGNLLMATMVLLTMRLWRGWRPSPTARAFELVTIGCALVVAIDLKYTGLVYAAIVGGVYVIALAIQGGRRWWPAIRAVLLTGVAAAIVGVGFIGATSYVQNTVDTGNPIYPIGVPSVDSATQTVDIGIPRDVAHSDPYAQWFVSNAISDTYNEVDLATVPYKVPFVVSVGELKTIRDSADIRLGGYGPWFGGVLIVSLAAGCWLLIRRWSSARRALLLVLPPFVVIAVGIPLVDGSWWARYTPHAWILPIAIVAALWAARVRVLPWLVSGALLINAAMVVGPQSFGQLQRLDDIHRAGDLHAYCGVYLPTGYQGLAYQYHDDGLTILSKAQYAGVDPSAVVTVPLTPWFGVNFVRTGCNG